MAHEHSMAVEGWKVRRGKREEQAFEELLVRKMRRSLAAG